MAAPSLFDLTAERAREAFAYNPATGALIWKIKTNRSVIIGSRAGCLKKGRYYVRLDGTLYEASRVIWLWVTGKWPKHEVDHRDTDPSNDRWRNLREATHQQNQLNKRGHHDAAVGLKGVYRRPNGYRSSIMLNGEDHFLGNFHTAEDAHAAYCKAAADLHGEFARG